jgi:hypothetical protein
MKFINTLIIIVLILSILLMGCSDDSLDSEETNTIEMVYADEADQKYVEPELFPSLEPSIPKIDALSEEELLDKYDDGLDAAMNDLEKLD